MNKEVFFLMTVIHVTWCDQCRFSVHRREGAPGVYYVCMCTSFEYASLVLMSIPVWMTKLLLFDKTNVV